eukprot:TRINITY_DN3227_c0_g1_i1.p1 TRINITY_DN3227_c0_g1~~TRINITY_DN3227_c0_g1_i1.p1  ORF type:complete len:284 (+),score=25.71 TRINITY_DN3227_c0_g1_i1:34-885(+)
MGYNDFDSNVDSAPFLGSSNSEWKKCWGDDFESDMNAGRSFNSIVILRWICVVLFILSAGCCAWFLVKLDHHQQNLGFALLVMLLTAGPLLTWLTNPNRELWTWLSYITIWLYFIFVPIWVCAAFFFFERRLRGKISDNVGTVIALLCNSFFLLIYVAVIPPWVAACMHGYYAPAMQRITGNCFFSMVDWCINTICGGWRRLALLGIAFCLGCLENCGCSKEWLVALGLLLLYIMLFMLCLFFSPCRLCRDDEKPSGSCVKQGTGWGVRLVCAFFAVLSNCIN